MELDQVPVTPDSLTLDSLLADAAARLTHAVRDRDAPMHTPAVVTGDGDARIMVLRAADAASLALRFHTDTRSPKVATLAADPRLTVLAYDPAARVQLRMTALAKVQATGPVADTAWAQASPLSRRVYLVEAGPGAPLDAPQSALPAQLRDRRPTLAESEAGRAHFAVIVADVIALDWLRLGRDGGVRARFVRDGDGWQGAWIAP
jgi:general stress protein 26